MFRTINRLSLTVATGLAITACNVDDGSEPVDDGLETQLSQLEADNEAAALHDLGLDEAAAEEGAPEGERPPRDGERPPRDGERPPRDGERMPPEGEGERDCPEPGVDPAEFCAENLDAFIAGCEERVAEAEALPEDFPGCEVVAEQVCMRRAAQGIRQRIRGCHEECRPEARAVFEMCAEDGGEPEACREEAMGVAEACHQACPDAPRGEGEEGERPQRGEGDEGERPAPDSEAGERPERPAPDGEAGERPERPAPEDGAELPEGELPEGERPERPAPEEGAERPERPSPEGREDGQRPPRPGPEDGEAGEGEDGEQGFRRPPPPAEGEDPEEG